MVLNNSEKNRSGESGRPWIFLLGTIIWTWILYSIPIITGGNLFRFFYVLLYALGGLGPLIVSAVLIANNMWDRDSSVSSFIKLSLDPRTLSLRWYTIIVLLVIVLTIGPLFFEPNKLVEEGLFEYLNILFLLIGAIFGGLEELGWRGYAQESLQRKFPIIVSGLVIGIFWVVWHLPLFFMEGTYQSTLGIGIPAFWDFNISIIIVSPVYAWIYNSAGSITFAAVLYHALGNIAGELIRDSSRIFSTSLNLIVLIIIIISAWGWINQKKIINNENTGSES